MPKSPFKTDKTENRKSRLFRLAGNFLVPFRSTGGRVIFVSSDFKEAHVRIKLNFWTRNYVGTIYGGSLYGAMDAVYMMQLIMILGKDYVVWDKAAAIRFIKPAKSTIYARFLLSDEVLKEMKDVVARDGRCNRDLTVSLVTADGTVHAEVTKTLYIASKEYYLKTKGEVPKGRWDKAVAEHSPSKE